MSDKNGKSIRRMHSAVPVMASVMVSAAYVIGAIFLVLEDEKSAEAQILAVNEVIEIPQIDEHEPQRRSLGYSQPETSLPDVIPSVPDFSADTLAELPEPDIVDAPEVVQPVFVQNTSGYETSSGPRIAIIIDDMGLNYQANLRILALEAEMTIAVLPYAPNATLTAEIAQAGGLDVLVHMPMEPIGLADPGPNALLLQLDDNDLEARARWAMARVPGAIGLNNHMGSRFTQDPHAMRVVLSSLADQQPLFLDSLTSASSRGGAVSRGLGLTTLERDIFLDHEIDPVSIRARLAEAEALAHRRGWAIVIGHPHDETLTALEQWIEEAQARDIDFVTLSRLSAQLEARGIDQIEASLQN